MIKLTLVIRVRNNDEAQRIGSLVNQEVRIGKNRNDTDSITTTIEKAKIRK